MAKLSDQYLYLPEQFWYNHDLCESMVQQIEEFIVGEQFNKLKYYPIILNDESDLPNCNENILDFLLRSGRIIDHDKAVLNNIVYALVMDTCYFLQEALACSLKMRLSVTFSLLRKPFVYNLLVFLRLVYENDFIQKFCNVDSFDSTRVTKERKMDLIRLSLQNSTSLKEENADLIYDIIFNKYESKSIINMSEQALHLSTTRNENNKTKKKNLNFIFSTYSNNESMWDYLYSKLPLLLLYLLDVLDSLILPIVELDDNEKMQRLSRRIEIFKK